jgi:hypothetical protein
MYWPSDLLDIDTCILPCATLTTTSDRIKVLKLFARLIMFVQSIFLQQLCLMLLFHTSIKITYYSQSWRSLTANILGFRHLFHEQVQSNGSNKVKLPRQTSRYLHFVDLINIL